jgi:4-hydroxy-3-methylbut-2-enyl diphosphate reductase
VFVDELDEVPPGSRVVFAAHGVAPAVREQASDRRLSTIDATCPLVAKVHAEVRRFAANGYQVLLIGHPEHEEVQGTTGEAPQAVVVVDDADAADQVVVADPTRVAYVTQTTLAVDEVADIIARLRARLPLLEGPARDDICYATQNRQDAAKALAGECDVVLVVGSPNSSNSNRLVEVVRREGCPAHLLDDDGELQLSWIGDAGTIGITAGASAPEGLVQRVVAAIGALGPLEVDEYGQIVEDVQFALPAEVR